MFGPKLPIIPLVATSETAVPGAIGPAAAPDPELAPEPPSGQPVPGDEQDGGTAAPGIAIYDFRQPGGIERHHQRALHLLLEVYAHRVSGGLTANLGVPVHMSLATLEQLTWEDYVASLPEPTALASCALTPLPGRLTVHLPLSLAGILVEGRLGGGKVGRPFGLERALTDIEQKILDPVIEVLVGELPPVLASLVSLRAGGVSQVAGARFLQAVAASEMCLVATFPVSVGDHDEADMSLCFQISTLRSIIEAMVFQELEGGTGSDEEARVIAERVGMLPVELALRFPPISLGPMQIASLEPGDVIPLHYDQDRPLELVLGGGERLLEGVPASSGKRLAAVVVGLAGVTRYDDDREESLT